MDSYSASRGRGIYDHSTHDNAAIILGFFKFVLRNLCDHSAGSKR